MKNKYVVLATLLCCLSAMSAKAEVKNIVLKVKDLQCTHCATAVNKELHKLGEISKTATNVNEGKIKIELKPKERFDYKAIKKKVKKAGFKVEGAELEVTGLITYHKEHEAIIKSESDGSMFTLIDTAHQDEYVDDWFGVEVYLEDALADKVFAARNSKQKVFVRGKVHEHIGGSPLGLVIDEIKFL